MRPVTKFFEHETKPYDWAERDLGFIQRLNETHGTEVLRPAISGTSKTLKAFEYVGVVRFGPHIVEILPKIYSQLNDRSASATKNLLHMLDYAHNLAIGPEEAESISRQESDWYEVLIRIFSLGLLREWRRSPLRKYVRKDETLYRLRGKLKVLEHSREIARRHLFPVIHDEFSADNAVSQLFRHSVEALYRQTQSSFNRATLSTLREELAEVTLRQDIQVSETQAEALSRLDRSYIPLLNLARLLLKKEASHLSAGRIEQYAFLIDMNRLFEQFVLGFIRRHRDVFRRNWRIVPKASGAACYLARTASGKPVFRLEPDIAFIDSSTGSFPLLLDTKYKLLSGGKVDGGVSQSDFYQMHAYSARYRCPRVVLIYPKLAGESEWDGWFALLGSNPPAQIRVKTIDLTLDLGTSEGITELKAQLRDVFEHLDLEAISA